MPNEFIARNGVIALNNSIITGSLLVTSTVGIGKTSANATLDVSGSVTITGSFRVGAFTSSFAGPVGIGTTTPAYTLDVSGSTRASGSLDVIGRLTANGQIYVPKEPSNGTRNFLFNSDNNALLATVSNDYLQVQQKLVLTAATTFNNGTLNFPILNGTGNSMDIGGSALNVYGGNGNVVNISRNFSTQANGIINAINIAPTLSPDAGSSNQGYRGIYYNPNTASLASAFNRAIETVTGNVILGSTSGNVGIGPGKTSPSARLDVNGSAIITGSLNVTQGITGSLFGTSSWAINALTASIVASTSNAFIQNGNSFGAQALLGTNDAQNLAFETNGTVRMLVSGSNGTVGIGTTTPGGINRASTILDTRGTTWFSADDYGQLEITPTTGNGGTAVIRQYTTSPRNGGDLKIRVDANIQGGNFIISTNNDTERFRITNAGATIITGSLTVFTGSAVELQVTNTGVRIGNIITDAHTVTGSFNVSGSITTTGTITAQTLVVQTVTSSVSFMTGSTRFGSLLANTHQFTGSVSMTGSLTTVGTASFNGPVGIGTTTPAFPLDVNGGIAVGGARALYNAATDNIYLNARVLQNQSNVVADGMYIGYDSFGTTNAHLRFYANGVNERMRIDASTGNVGIGTTNPTERLSVLSSGAGVSAARFTDGNRADIVLSFPASGVASIDSYLGTGDGALAFRTATNERMRITSGGNVGIGTTTPTSYSGFTTLNINNATNGGVIDLLNNGTRVGSFYNTANEVVVGSITSVPLQFFTNFSEKMRITSAGNVGIGTTSPQVKLDVKGTSTGTLTGMALFRDASTNGNGLVVRAGTGRVDLLATWIDSGINTDLTFTPTTSGGTQNEAMRITSAGNVGIGTTSPAYKLDVSGSTSISGGGLIVSGTLATSGSTSQGLVAPLKFTTATANTNYTLVRTDEGKMVEMNYNVDGPLIVTIPLNSSVPYPVGTEISIIQIGTGTTVITGSSGVTVNSYLGYKTIDAQYGVASVVKRGTDSWYLFGNLS